jgi:hypothetical protein
MSYHQASNQSKHSLPKALLSKHSSNQSTMSSSNNVVVNVAEWDTSAIKYMAPKINDKGGKSISLISKQTNRMLHITTPLMMTWGISDFIDDAGNSDGKYSISLNFPNDEYRTPATDEFLVKLKAFEQQILQDAVVNSDTWWGESMSLELCKHTFFPFLKYSKNKDTKKLDLTKPPSIRAKVPCYNGKWGVEIYDTSSRLIFPSENEHVTPMDFVPKLSRVACGLQCTGIWIGGKGWGLTWKMFQCIVKPREVVTVYGKCHINLSTEDKEVLDKQVVPDEGATEEEVLATATATVPVKKVVPPVKVPVVQSVQVEDSDDDDEGPAPAPQSSVPEEEVAVAAVAAAAAAAAAAVEEEVAAVAVVVAVEEEVSPPVQVPAKVIKKIIKKKV